MSKQMRLLQCIHISNIYSARRYPSFDNWGGLSSFSNFDNFYGVDNFSGVVSDQVVVEQQEEVVCQAVSIEIVQQKLLVLQEMAKQ